MIQRISLTSIDFFCDSTLPLHLRGIDGFSIQIKPKIEVVFSSEENLFYITSVVCNEVK